MAEIDDGGTAFPRLANEITNWSGEDITGGMRLRDWFAGQALIGMAQSAGFQGAPWPKLAEDAYEAADAMLKARAALSRAGA